MDEECPKCHVVVKSTDYFCYNCGNNLKPAPPSLSPYSQGMLYLGSILLPPLGLWWAIPYLRQIDKKYKIVGVVAIVLTLVSLVIMFVWLQRFVTETSNQVNLQLNTLGY